MSIIKRMKAPTPKFFRVLRNVGIVLVTTAGTILTTPVSLPAVILTIAGYVAVAGSVMMALSQATVVNELDIQNEKPMKE